MGGCLATPWMSRLLKASSSDARSPSSRTTAAAPSASPPSVTGRDDTAAWIAQQRVTLASLQRHGAQLAAAQQEIGCRSTPDLVASEAARVRGESSSSSSNRSVSIGVVALFSSPAAAGVPTLLQALCSVYAGMDVRPPNLSSASSAYRASREVLDLSSIAEYYGERVPQGFSYLVNYLPCTVQSEEHLHACFLAQLRPEEVWPQFSDADAMASILHRPIDRFSASHCGIAVVSALVLERLVACHADAVASTPHSVKRFARHIAEAIVSSGTSSSSDGPRPPPWPLVVVVTDVDAWVAAHDVVDDCRLLWWTDASTSGDGRRLSRVVASSVDAEGNATHHPLTQLRSLAKTTFGVENDDHVFMMGWLGHRSTGTTASGGVPVWQDAADPRTYQLRRVLQTTCSLASEFQAALEGQPRRAELQPPD